MPRAGGDYVWQSRILDGPPGAVAGAVTIGDRLPIWSAERSGSATPSRSCSDSAAWSSAGPSGCWRGGIGFVLAATGWWLILALWAPIYGAILNLEFVQPVAALAGITGLPSAARYGTFIVSLIVIAIVTGLVALGMAGYARIQRVEPGHRPARARRGLRTHGDLFTGGLPGRLRSRGTGDVERLQRLPDDDRRRDRVLRGAIPGARPARVRARHLAADPAHAVLAAVPELGRDALRRGPRGG